MWPRLFSPGPRWPEAELAEPATVLFLAGLEHQVKRSINEMLADRRLRDDNLYAQVRERRGEQPGEPLGWGQGIRPGPLTLLGTAEACGPGQGLSLGNPQSDGIDAHRASLSGRSWSILGSDGLLWSNAAPLKCCGDGRGEGSTRVRDGVVGVLET